MLYALFGHRGDWRAAEANLQGSRVNQPLAAFQAPSHKGPLGKRFSFLTINTRDVVLSALKKAENGEDLIVRVVEAKGRPARGVEIGFAGPVEAVREVTGREDPVGDAKIRDGKLVFDITPYHLRTFAVKLKPVPNVLSKPRTAFVDLPFDTDVISADKHKADGDFDRSGRSFPAEMLPDTIVSGGIPFRIGPKADFAANAVACAGQTVRLPEGGFRKLYVLAADSATGLRGITPSGPARTAFKVGGAAVEVLVENWSGFYGQWDKRLWTGDDGSATSFDRGDITFAGLVPGYVRQAEVAYFTTHRHLRTGANDPYQYAYLYKLGIDLPEGTREVTLPALERVKVLAMTVAVNENDGTRPAQPLFDTLLRDRADYGRFTPCPTPRIWPEKGTIEAGRAITVALNAGEAEIRYTLDGSVPLPNSARYEGPLSLDRSAVLNAIAFAPGKMPSLMASAYFSRSFPIKGARYLFPVTQRRGGPGAESPLIDLVRGGDRAWQAFDKTDLDVVLDLGQVRTIESVMLSCRENHGSRIFLPVAVQISISSDDKDFRTVVSRDYPAPDKAGPAGSRELAFDLKRAEARFVRVKAVNMGALPKWHPNAANPAQNALMSFDEIIVR
jgi:alpha-mannosidase